MVTIPTPQASCSLAGSYIPSGAWTVRSSGALNVTEITNWLWARKKIMPLRSLLLTQYRRSMSFTFHVSIYRVAIKVNSDSQAIFYGQLWGISNFFRSKCLFDHENTIRKRPYREMLRWVMLRIGGCGPPQSCFA